LRTTVLIEVFRVKCPDCGVKVEKVPLLPGKAPFSKRFEDAVGQACESAPARQVARRFGLPASTVRAIDLRYLERWAEARRQPVLRQMGVDEIHLGKTEKFLTVVSNLESREPLWFGRERKKETLDQFFSDGINRTATPGYLSRLRGYVGTLPAQHPAVGAELPDRLRQVPHHAACQRRRG
jgi:transposase